MKTFEEFQDIDSARKLADFLRKHAFVEDNRPTPDDVLGLYVGQVDGMRATITHSWRDPSGPFENKPDIHKIRLEVDRHGSRNVSYEG
jgi:hypothetical protein